MTVTSHPGDELLLRYATGGFPFPFEVVLACHLALCSHCRLKVSDLETLGGAMLESLEDAPLQHGALEAALACLNEPAPAVLPPAAGADDPETVRLLPAPLRALIGRPMRELEWIDRSPDLSVAELSSIAECGVVMRLFRARPGVVLPPHDHGGTELTLVLAGGLVDESGVLHRGDLQTMGPGERHRPAAEEKDGCIVLYATDGELIPVGESP